METDENKELLSSPIIGVARISAAWRQFEVWLLKGVEFGEGLSPVPKMRFPDVWESHFFLVKFCA